MAIKKISAKEPPLRNQKVKDRKPDVRFLSELKDILYDQKWFKKSSDFPVYYMYRGMKEKNGLRYDITIIPFKMLGSEFPKTKGHYHQGNYGEVYLVLEGKAIYLIQRHRNNIVADVYAVKARKGEAIIIPPGYGHITINPGSKNLKMANWVSPVFKSDYQPFVEKGGACYFFTKRGWIKNKNYKKIPRLRFDKALGSVPQNLDFLKG